MDTSPTVDIADEMSMRPETTIRTSLWRDRRTRSVSSADASLLEFQETLDRTLQPELSSSVVCDRPAHIVRSGIPDHLQEDRGDNDEAAGDRDVRKTRPRGEPEGGGCSQPPD